LDLGFEQIRQEDVDSGEDYGGDQISDKQEKQEEKRQKPSCGVVTRNI
jgi:hypothetical protein